VPPRCRRVRAALLATGSLRYVTQDGTALAGSVVIAQGAVFTVAAFAEEALFRGYPFQVLARAAGPVAATVASAALFAVAHAWNPEVGAFALVNIFLAGVLLAVAYLRTLSLWFATAVHGLELGDGDAVRPAGQRHRRLRHAALRAGVGGPDWWSGGAFGPEGGLVGTLGFGVALLAVLRLRWCGRTPASRGRAAGAGQGKGGE
jgi:uncharacterized protein